MSEEKARPGPGDEGTGRLWILFLLVLTAFLVPKGSWGQGDEARTFFVSPVGNDRNPGTLERPFATLRAARDAVRRVNQGMKGDIVVSLRGGTYRLEETLEFGDRDSGTGGHRVIYRAYPGELPVLSGGVEITGWAPVGRGIWKAPARELNFRQLYVNGRRGTRARQPNSGAYYRLVLWDMGEKEILVNGAEVGAWRKPRDVEMVVQMAWTEAILRLDRVRTTGEGAGSWIRPSYARLAPQQPERDLVFARDYPPKRAGQAYHFENALEFLDEPGEWYLDRSEDTVYYRPRPGEDPARMEAVVPVVETLVRVRGTLDSPVRGLTFEGMAFEHSTWLRPSEEGHLPVQAMQYTIPPTVANEQYVGRPPAAVVVEAAHDVHFLGNVFRRLGAAGLDLRSGTAGTRVVGNAFADISGNGLMAGIFAAPTVEMHVPYRPADEREICRDDLVADNIVVRIGLDYPGGCGIAAGYTRGLVVEHNEIAYTPYTGVSMGWGWTHKPSAMGGNRILRNHVHHVMQSLCDGAAIYTLSLQPGTEISENYIHDMVRSPWAGDLPLAAIYHDEGSGGTRENPLVVRGNVVVTGGGVDRHHFHRAGLVLHDFNAQRPERLGELDGRLVVERAGPRPPHRAMRERAVPAETGERRTRQVVMMTELKDEAEAIRLYRHYHGPEGVWPEILHAARVSGLESLRIYLHGNRLVMILTLPEDLTLEEMNRRYAASSARVKEWGELMSGFQRPPPGAKPGEVWVTMELIHDCENGRLYPRR